PDHRDLRRHTRLADQPLPGAGPRALPGRQRQRPDRGHPTPRPAGRGLPRRRRSPSPGRGHEPSPRRRGQALHRPDRRQARGHHRAPGRSQLLPPGFLLLAHRAGPRVQLLDPDVGCRPRLDCPGGHARKPSGLDPDRPRVLLRRPSHGAPAGQLRALPAPPDPRRPGGPVRGDPPSHGAGRRVVLHQLHLASQRAQLLGTNQRLLRHRLSGARSSRESI
ncbi:uncharacterized protein METZ01_LOCUS465630, partial [marine metagenome]